VDFDGGVGANRILLAYEQDFPRLDDRSTAVAADKAPFGADPSSGGLSPATFSPREKGVPLAAAVALHTPSWNMCECGRAGGQGQIYLAPSGALKQPIDSGNTVFGSQSTALGKKIAKAIVAKKIT
jgi:hypothetical protein